MTEQEAIERIQWAIHCAHGATDAGKGSLRLNAELAEAAWNEMKAIAREDGWQTIDTAPSDEVVYVTGGTYITEAIKGERPLDVTVPAKRGDCGYGREWEFPLQSYYGIALSPTHWRPA